MLHIEVYSGACACEIVEQLNKLGFGGDNHHAENCTIYKPDNHKL